jgi:hypothetical protein
MWTVLENHVKWLKTTVVFHFANPDYRLIQTTFFRIVRISEVLLYVQSRLHGHSIALPLSQNTIAASEHCSKISTIKLELVSSRSYSPRAAGIPPPFYASLSSLPHLQLIGVTRWLTSGSCSMGLPILLLRYYTSLLHPSYRCHVMWSLPCSCLLLWNPKGNNLNHTKWEFSSLFNEAT